MIEMLKIELEGISLVKTPLKHQNLSACFYTMYLQSNTKDYLIYPKDFFLNCGALNGYHFNSFYIRF